MVGLGAINPIGSPVSAVTPVKAKKQDKDIQNESNKLQEQAMQMQPAFTSPVYMYPVQPMYVMPQPVLYMPQQFNMPMPTKQEDNKVSMSEALRAQVLPQSKTKIILENNKPEKEKKPAIAETKPEDVISNALKNQEVKTPEKAIESFKGQMAENEKEVQKKRPQIVESEALRPQLDVDALVEILNSPDYEEQANAMEAVAQISKLAPEKADELLDIKVLDTLAGIMSQDTTKVPEAEKKLAQRNKEYAMFTTAILQKQYTDGVKKVANTQVPLDEVVGLAGIVNNLKNDENAGTREAALKSLDYIKAPEYKEDLAFLFKEATEDTNADVRKTAKENLKNLNKK